MLTLIDKFTRECLAIDVARRLTREDLLERLSAVFAGDLRALAKGEAKQNPKQSMPDMPGNDAQQKSQTPIITAFGFECLGLSGPLIAAEGLEQALQTSQKRPPVFKGEAKPEAVFVDGLPNVTALATWLSQNLSHEQLTELASQLQQVKE